MGTSAKPARRFVSRRTALTGAVAVGATVVVSGVTYVASAKTPNGGAVQGPVVVRVRDNAGRLEIFAGTRRIEVRDKDLANRLLQAAQG
jgi:hypothetical protein